MCVRVCVYEYVCNRVEVEMGLGGGEREGDTRNIHAHKSHSHIATCNISTNNQQILFEVNLRQFND